MPNSHIRVRVTGPHHADHADGTWYEMDLWEVDGPVEDTFFGTREEMEATAQRWVSSGAVRVGSPTSPAGRKQRRRST